MSGLFINNTGVRSINDKVYANKSVPDDRRQ